MTIIDGDSHIYEPRSMWKDYTPAADQDRALSIETDALGYSWVTLAGRSLERPAWVAGPTGGDFTAIGQFRQGHLKGLPNPTPTYDEMPEEFWSPKARVGKLDEWHIDEAVVFNQWGFQWEPDLWDDMEASKVNHAAWNRYCADLVTDSGGRLHPAGHIRLDAGEDWLEEQLRTLRDGGVRLALFTPMLVDGKRLSHPDVDHVWRLFVEYDVMPAWHVSNNNRRVLDDFESWADNDTRALFKLVPHLFTRVSPQIGLVDLAVNGVFEKYPDLRILVAEFGADWFPQLCQRVDGSWGKYTELAGEVYSDLPRLPGDYLREQVMLVCSFPSDADASLLGTCPGQLAYGGDYPHPEGLDDPFEEFKRRSVEVDPAIGEGFYGGNLAALLAGER
ncbi:MAG TPA: amidohydrolase family protein [Iamia sp.]|nr:amidohydrolase family protein [Iamia sp.]